MHKQLETALTTVDHASALVYSWPQALGLLHQYPWQLQVLCFGPVALANNFIKWFANGNVSQRGMCRLKQLDVILTSVDHAMSAATAL